MSQLISLTKKPNSTKLRLNMKKIKKFKPTFYKSSSELNIKKQLIEIRKEKINEMLNNYIKWNKSFNDGKGSIPYELNSSYNEQKSLTKNSSSILKNLFLASVLNMANNNTNNISLKNNNKRNQSSQCSIKENDIINSNDSNNIINKREENEKKDKLNESNNFIDNLKYIKQNPYFKDLNFKPSSQKSWIYAYQEEKPLVSRNSKFSEINDGVKHNILKINLIKNKNKTNKKIKDFSYLNHFREEQKNKKASLDNICKYYNNMYLYDKTNENLKKKEQIKMTDSFVNKKFNQKYKIFSNNKPELNKRLMISNRGIIYNNMKYIKKNMIYGLNLFRNDRNISLNYINEKKIKNNNTNLPSLNVDLIPQNHFSFINNSIKIDNNYKSLNSVLG